MKILLITQYFYPEPFLINDLVLTLTEQGHEVVIYTGKPNYPDGVIYDGYKSEGFIAEYFDENIKVYRVPLRPRYKSGAKNLLLNYFSFVFSGLRNLNKIDESDFDTVFVFCLSPITSVIPAIYYKWKFKTHLSIWVQDLWPQSLVATGYVKNRFILKAVEFLVRWVYKCADSILIQSKGFESAIQKYTSKDKIVYYPNSIKLQENSYNVSLPPNLDGVLDKNFCLVFAGNLGKAQALETIVDVSEKIRDIDNIKIILIGSGSELGWLQEQKVKRNLDNLELPGRFPMHEMPSIYKKAKALLVSLRDNEIINLTIPSKIQSYLAASRPIIGSLNGEGSNVIEKSGGGFTSPAGDVYALEKSIRRLYSLSTLERDNIGKSGFEYFMRNFEMKTQTNRLVNIIKDRI